MGAKILKTLTVANILTALANTGIGIYCIIKYLTDLQPAETVLAAYFVVFSLIYLVSQKKDDDGRPSLQLIRRNFGFLGSGFGMAVYLVFLGSLGLSFGWGSTPGHYLPFIAGMWTIGLAVVSAVVGCFHSRRGYESIDEAT
eukprot:TRINITY_DN3792_c1_g1_i1.p1 TRINITY_DN3792_c1_g1~~TRINITY_DN3792_c1_g1_i1.p1  ORF type:complete len:156 (+),score=11.94 TRINITY_DN3792_c1_g1_i1:43-468(+)